MFASVGLGAFLIVILLVRVGMWLFRSRKPRDVSKLAVDDHEEDLQAAIDRWERIQSRHSHSMYWDE